MRGMAKGRICSLLRSYLIWLHSSWLRPIPCHKMKGLSFKGPEKYHVSTLPWQSLVTFNLNCAVSTRWVNRGTVIINSGTLVSLVALHQKYKYQTDRRRVSKSTSGRCGGHYRYHWFLDQRCQWRKFWRCNLRKGATAEFEKREPVYTITPCKLFFRNTWHRFELLTLIEFTDIQSLLFG